jgi:hypothetical protein
MMKALGAALAALIGLASWGLTAPPAAQAQYGQPQYGQPQYGGLVECSSYDDRPRTCPMDTSGRVRVYRQISQTPCIEGTSYRVMRGAIEVRRGCRAVFASAGYNEGGGWGGSGGGSWGGSGSGYATVRCESVDGRRRYCPMDTRNGVRLERELSSSPCIRGTSWGSDRNGVWVTRGCRAEFAGFSGWGGSGGSGGGGWGGSGGGGWGGSGGGGSGGGGWGGSGGGGGIENYTQRVDCYSLNGGGNFCTMLNARNARLFQQLSDTRCVRDRNWGIRGNGIWVDKGCSGRFVAP